MSTPDPRRPGTRRAARTRRPGPVRALRAAAARHKAAAVATVVVLGGVGAGGGYALAATGGAPQRHAAREGTPQILAPADGALRVGGRTVAQMTAACDGHSCYHVPAGDPVTVNARAAKTLPLRAGESTSFTASAFDLADTSTPVNLGLVDGALDLSAVPDGRYQVTVVGNPNGGWWQFVLHVDKAPRHRH